MGYLWRLQEIHVKRRIIIAITSANNNTANIYPKPIRRHLAPLKFLTPINRSSQKHLCRHPPCYLIDINFFSHIPVISSHIGCKTYETIKEGFKIAVLPFLLVFSVVAIQSRNEFNKVLS